MDMHARRNVESLERQLRESRRSFIEPLESRRLMSGSTADPVVTPSVVFAPQASGSTAVPGYSPAQLRTAYGITGNGSGQTIAIVDAYSDPNIASDLGVFDSHFGLSAPASFKQVSASGNTTSLPAANAGWDTEISLDVEWAHAIAPAANIILVDASSASLSSLMSAVNYARNITTVSVVSMSWGSGEFNGETSYDSYFSTPAGHTGITFVAASGDEGQSAGAEWPAVSPDVLSVGGTTLTLSSTGVISSETAWSDSSGGASYFETLGVQAAATGLRARTSPDVAFDANPSTGVAVYDSIPYEGYSGWQEVGGTSVGAPSWAGIVAIADSARVAAKSSTLTTTQVLDDVYTIYSNSTNYSADFHDITSGSSLLGYEYVGFGGFGGRFGFGELVPVYVSATTGYDSLTGVGSPRGVGLISALTSTATGSAATVIKTAATTGKASAAIRAAIVGEANPAELLLAFQNVQAVYKDLPANTSDANVSIADAVTTTAAMNEQNKSEIPTVGSLARGDTMTSGYISTGADSAAAEDTSALALGSAKRDGVTFLWHGLSFGEQIARQVRVPKVSVAMSSPVIVPELGQAFRDIAQDVQHELAAVPSTFVAIREGGGMALALAIADAALLAYCYINQSRQKIAEGETIFHGRPQNGATAK